MTKLQDTLAGAGDVDMDLGAGPRVPPGSESVPVPRCRRDPLARYRAIDTHPRLLPVNLGAPLLPGTIEHAVDHLLEHAIDRSGIDPRFRHDATAAWPPARDPVPLPRWAVQTERATSNASGPMRHLSRIHWARLARFLVDARAGVGRHQQHSEHQRRLNRHASPRE